MRSALLAAWVVVLSMLLVACGQSSSSGPRSPVADVTVFDDDGITGVVLPEPYAVPHVDLDSASGGTYDLAEDAVKPLTLVFFGYTHCPDICQVVMADIASSLTRLDAPSRADVDMRFVTTDPARDDAATLRRYVSRFDPSFDALTGDLPAIVRLGQAFDVDIARGKQLASGGYDVAHGTQIIGVRPDGTAPFVWTEGTDPTSLADDLTAILDGSVGR